MTKKRRQKLSIQCATARPGSKNATSIFNSSIFNFKRCHPGSGSNIWPNALQIMMGIRTFNYFNDDLNNDLPTRGRIENITEDKDGVVDCVNGVNKVQLIHSILNLGGNRSRSRDKILGIIGMEKHGICVELITYSVAIYCNFPAPNLVD